VQFDRRTALWIWAAGLSAYVVAVFHRFSLGVAGVQAVERFGLSAAGLGLFSVVQLAVYCSIQVPVGLLVDRFGYRRLLVVGAVLMAAGQCVFAFAGDLPSALAARVLLGFGDGLTFISMVRLVAAWFPARRNPLLLQLTGLAGQLGAIASTVPLIYVLSHAGWRATFLGVAGLGLVVATVVATAVRERPVHAAVAAAPAQSLAEVVRGLRETWAEPGTRLGLWTHFVTQFPSMAFGLLWGYPFLVTAQGLSPQAAGLLLTVLTMSFMCFGPVLGHLVSRFPLRRSRMVIGIVVATAIAWTAVLAWPGRAPFWLLLTLVVVMGANLPGSMIGFDFARTFNTPRRLGSASGIVNMGGFLASLSTVLLIGFVLSLFSEPGSANYPPEAFTWAFAVQYPIWALGLTQVLRHRRRARRAYGGAPERAAVPSMAAA
jgi:MFS family permease